MRKLFVHAILCTCVASLAKAQDIRINVAGGMYTDAAGNAWLADDYFGGQGKVHSSCPVVIANTTDEGLYCKHRWFATKNAPSPFLYDLPVSAPGLYKVLLHFAEVWFTTAGSRMFNVYLEESLVIENLDIVSAAGGAKTAYVASFSTTVSDGFASIRLEKVLQNPLICGIEIFSLAKPTSPASTLPPSIAPIYPTSESPVAAPAEVSLDTPADPPTDAPAPLPTTPSAKTPIDVPTEAPVAAPVDVPVDAPVDPSTDEPAPPPTTPPSIVPIDPPTEAPVEADPATIAPVVPAPTDPNPSVKDILINCGGDDFIDTQMRVWLADKFVTGGKTYSNTADDIAKTTEDLLYQTERFTGKNSGEMVYEIPVPAIGDYQVILHFAEIWFTKPGQRVFDAVVEGILVPSIDIVQQAGGLAKAAITREVPTLVTDGFVSISFVASVNNPKLSAIEIKTIGPHLAHSVPGFGGYTGVDVDGNGSEAVTVDGSQSHTHGPGLSLISWVWKEGATVLGTSEVALLTLAVGNHDVSLTVVDSAGNEAIESTTVTVLPAGFPEISSISPDSGVVSGGDHVTINGSGFNLATGVRFGETVLSGNDIDVIDSSTIQVASPNAGLGAPVAVSIISPSGESNAATFTYIGATPIDFNIQPLTAFSGPTSVAFGPDSRLYVGTAGGKIGKFTLNSDYTQVVSAVEKVVANDRFILGIAFDPLDTSPNPTVYCSSSEMFHGDTGISSGGSAINGKIHAVSGANMDMIVDVVTGLPVSEHDHGVNGLEFGNNGELYFNVGSNTNGGIPGELSASQKQNENFFSAAALVANLGKPGYNGDITYSSSNNGNPISGYGPNGVEIFASGLRNSFGMTLHSNGKLYATDNGPNKKFGDMATGCGPGQQIPDQYTKDELNLLVKGAWYGHPNRKRGETDARQCTWKAPNSPSNDDHTRPLMTLQSSTNGLIEFASNHFKGQMRGNLVAAKYKDGLFRIILAQGGSSVVPSSNPAIDIGGDHSLDVTQAPNGNLIVARYSQNAIYYHEPVEPLTSAMSIKSVFPRRGGLAGGSTLSIYGVNFSGTPTVTVGGNNCENEVLVNSKKITCTLPLGVLGAADVSVTAGGEDAFLLGYRYIRGVPV